MSSRSEAVTAGCAIAALLFSGVTYWTSHQENEKTSERVTEAERRQLASRVSLQEAPQYACHDHNDCSGQVQWVVVNFNAAQLADVWVQGTKGRAVKMFNLPACTMYSVPVGFTPSAVHFLDVYGRWRVPVSGLPEPNGAPMPTEDSDDSPWLEDVRNCPN